jgi:AraC-like DNA-binding protein
MDLLLDLIRVLRPRAVLFGAGFDASGEWALSFRKRDDLLFCWVEEGECQLLRPGSDPVTVRKGDFALIRTSTPFTLASMGSVEPIDSEAAVLASKRQRLRLGSGDERPVTLHAGKFVVESVNEDLLPGLLPQLIHLAAGDPALGRVRSLLEMNETEARRPGPASEFVIVRLVELIFVEILRKGQMQSTEDQKGLLAGMADKVTQHALVAIHEDVARSWTVADLAKLCGVSRSTFATRFRHVVGVGPIEYLLQWRMALAKDELCSGRKSVLEIAYAVGFQSSSAFSSAFTREVGCPPTQYARRHLMGQSGSDRTEP